MKNSIYTILRDQRTATADFRRAAHQAATLLATETLQHIEEKSNSITTPVAKTTGFTSKYPITLVPVLRSGLALLPSFLEFFTDARVGFVGCRRDEKTAEATEYYRNIPRLTKKDTVIILDPMLATGGSATDAINASLAEGACEEQVIAAFLVAAPEGVATIKKTFPRIRLVIGAIDKQLNNKKYIVPGLGDFGDRYFGNL